MRISQTSALRQPLDSQRQCVCPILITMPDAQVFEMHMSKVKCHEIRLGPSLRWLRLRQVRRIRSLCSLSKLVIDGLG